MTTRFPIKWLAVVAITWLAHPALAEVIAPEITLDGSALAAELRVRPTDRDTTNTAVVASNTGPTEAIVRCAAFNANGRALGSAVMRVPAHGLRYLRASILADRVDFVGQVRCRTRNHSVVGSAFLVGPNGVTNLPAQQHALNGVLYIEATVAASF